MCVPIFLIKCKKYVADKVDNMRMEIYLSMFIANLLMFKKNVYQNKPNNI